MHIQCFFTADVRSRSGGLPPAVFGWKNLSFGLIWHWLVTDAAQIWRSIFGSHGKHRSWYWSVQSMSGRCWTTGSAWKLWINCWEIMKMCKIHSCELVEGSQSFSFKKNLLRDFDQGGCGMCTVYTRKRLSLPPEADSSNVYTCTRYRDSLYRFHAKCVKKLYAA